MGYRGEQSYQRHEGDQAEDSQMGRQLRRRPVRAESPASLTVGHAKWDDSANVMEGCEDCEGYERQAGYNLLPRR
jgi:hypothetical protein